MTQDSGDVMTAPAAAAAAGVTYRQLDYWARRGWIEASRVEEVSKGRRVRWYTATDVARLGVLCHLARSGHDVGACGPRVGTLKLVPGSLVVVDDDPDHIAVVHPGELRDVVTRPGRWTVVDPTRWLQPAAHDVDDETVVPLTVRSA